MQSKHKALHKSQCLIWLFIALAFNVKAVAGTTCTSIAAGNWSNPDIWDCGGAAAVPDADDSVTINNFSVVLDIDATIQSVTVSPIGDLNVGASVSGLTLAATNGNVDLSASNINLSGDLTISANGSGDIILDSVVGDHSLTLNTSGSTILNNVIGLSELVNNIITDAPGQTVINGQTIQSSGAIVFNDPVTLSNPIFFMRAQTIEFMNTLDSDSQGLDTDFFIDSADFVAFHGDVGRNHPLKSFDSAQGTTLITADITIDGGQIVFDGPLEIDNNPSITHNGFPISSIVFNDTVSRANQNTQSTLTLTTQGAGEVTFLDDVAVDNLIINELSGNSTFIFANIDTIGHQIYGGSVVTGGPPQLSASFIEFNDTLRFINDDLTLNLRSPGSIAAASISGDGGIIKNGPGDIVLAGNNIYSGATSINDGTLLIDGSTNNSTAITVNGGVLGGNGIAEVPVDINTGSIAPGSSPGNLSTGDLFLDNNGVYEAEINGLIAGTEHDQLTVTGTVIINNASLDLSGTYIPAGLNDSIILINNDGTDLIIGNFLNLPEGSFVDNNGPLAITYTGGDGNDVALNDNEAVLTDGFETIE